MKGQLMVTPQGSEAKEDKTKTKRKKRKLCMATQAKTGSLIEDSSWSISHREWAELACSDFTPMDANINGGLLSDLMLRTSLGSGGVGGWEEERRRTIGYRWWLYLFEIKLQQKKGKKSLFGVFLKLLMLMQSTLTRVVLIFDLSMIITIKWG